MIEFHQFPHVFSSIYPGDEFGELLMILEELYFKDGISYTLKSEILAEVKSLINYDEMIDHWHSYRGDDEPLYTWLGMTKPQYQKFLSDGSYRPWNEEDYDNRKFIDEYRKIGIINYG